MSPEGRKVARLDPPTSSTLHFRRRPHPRLIPRASSSSRIAWPRKSTSLASLQPRSSASAYGGPVDLRFPCTFPRSSRPSSVFGPPPLTPHPPPHVPPPTQISPNFLRP